MGFFYCFTGKSYVLIGRDKKNDIIVGDSLVSRHHVRIDILKDRRMAVASITGLNGVKINDQLFSQGEKIVIGLADRITIGITTLIWMNEYVYCTEAKAANYLDVDTFVSCICKPFMGIKTFIPAIRKQRYIDKSPIEIEGPPARRAPEKPSIVFAAGPALTMAIPIMLGAGRKISIISSIAAAIWASGNVLGRHRKQKNEEKRRRNSYYAYINSCENLIKERHRECISIVKEKYPTIEACLSDGANPYLVWNKDITTDDGLMIRVGIGEQMSPLNISVPKDRFAQIDDSLKELPYKLQKAYMKMANVPVCIDFNKMKVIGFLSDDNKMAMSILSAILIQFMVLIKPDKLRIITSIHNEYISELLLWLRLSPHYCGEDYYTGIRRCVNNYKTGICHDISTGGEICDRGNCGKGRFGRENSGRGSNDRENKYNKSNNFDGVNKEKEDLLRNRVLNDDVSNPSGMINLLLTDNVRDANDFTGTEGNIVILTKRQMIEFPSIVECVLSVKKNYQGIIYLHETSRNRVNVHFDRMHLRQCQEYARQLTCMWGKGGENDIEIPTFVSFEKMYEEVFSFNQSDIQIIQKRWKVSNIRKSIAFPIGIGDKGKLIQLDLHEKHHGPHGTIAGTTGSGKSELLTTMILSAAMTYPPDKLGFFLIDYKGGGMSNLFSKLPHLLGSISNLSPSESHRAMISIQSENRRRQQIFIDSGVNNINDYTKLYDDGCVKEAMPHVMIIIDEFAELKKEQPEYMAQLISVAAVGRSLGIHLILATQKPTGVVDEKIRSNSKFRICLRVEDKSDSQDMLHKQDAAYIRECGRGYLQVGNDEIYEIFQCGYAMGKLSSENEAKEELFDSAIRRIVSEGGSEITNVKGGGEKETVVNILDEPDEQETTAWIETPSSNWHEYCMHLISRAYEENKMEKSRPLWLPSLPEDIDLNSFGMDEVERGIYAIADDPYSQSYHKLFYNPYKGENVAIIGGPGTGKSNLMQCLLLTLLVTNGEETKGTREEARKEVTETTTEEVIEEAISFYIIDGGGGLLEGFSKSKMCGGYINADETNNIRMLILFIRDIVRERRSKGNREQHYQDFQDKVVLIVDNYGECFKGNSQEADQAVIEIQKYGKNTGVSIILSALNVGQQELPFRIASQMDNNLILGFMDAYTSAGLLKKQAREIPKISCVPGRGICQHEDRILEFQAVNTSDQKIITSVIERINASKLSKARIYPHVPDDRSIGAFLERAMLEYPVANLGDKPLLPLAYEEESGRIFVFELLEISHVIICGRMGSGKKTYLKLVDSIATTYGIDTHHITSLAELLEYISNCSSLRGDEEKLCNSSSEKVVIGLIANLEKLADEIENLNSINSESPAKYSKEEIIEYFDNLSKSNKTSCLFSILDDKPGNDFRRTDLYEKIMRKPYVIYMGGCLDEQRMFDFSYLPYSVQTKKKNPGSATVMKYDNRKYYGDIIIPEMEE